MNTNLTFAYFHFSLFVATFLVFPVVPIVFPGYGRHNGETQQGNTMGMTGNTRKVATKSEK